MRRSGLLTAFFALAAGITVAFGASAAQPQPQPPLDWGLTRAPSARVRCPLRATIGVSTGAEENKMGLKGSSTRTLILDNAKIPADNVIGEIGKGHHVAFNILNIGRAKLGAGAVGGAKTALNDAILYAKQRIAFGKPIASFGAIKQKLAEMATRIWVAEGMVYRTAGLGEPSGAGVACPGDQ